MKYLKLFEEHSNNLLRDRVQEILDKYLPNIDEISPFTNEPKKLIPLCDHSESKYGDVIALHLRNDSGFTWDKINPGIKDTKFIQELCETFKDEFKEDVSITGYSFFGLQRKGKKMGHDPKNWNSDFGFGVENLYQEIMKDWSKNHSGVETNIYIKFLVSKY